MRSIGTRLTLLYTAAATASAAVLFGCGYVVLNQRLVRGLDALNAAEFDQLKARLGPDNGRLTPRIIDERIRETADAGSALFYINVDEPHSGMVFYSRNLDHRTIPDVKGQHIYNADLPGSGEVRVQEFVMPPFDVTIATPMTQVRSLMRSYLAVSIGLLLTMLFASAAIGRFLSNLVLQPLAHIRETATRIGSDSLTERIPIPGHNDELADLAQLLNQMFDRLEKSFDQIKRFAAEASHELKTPLSLIRLHGEKLLEDDTLPPQSVDAVVVQLEEVARMNRTIEDMLFLSKVEANAVSFDLRKNDPTKFLKDFEQDAQALAEHHDRRFRLEICGSGVAAFEERWMRQVWLNLLTNAFAATPEGGLVSMTSTIDDRNWQVVVQDEGPGLPEGELNRMFDRFVQFGTGARLGGGTGLGLPISRGIIARHSGAIVAENRCDHSGLRMIVNIPAT